MKSFLVTGGCGFIGRRVVESLLSRNAHFIRVVDNLSDGNPEILAQMAEMETLRGRSGPPKTRLQLVVGLRAGSPRRLKFRYYFEGFGAIVLPEEPPPP